LKHWGVPEFDPPDLYDPTLLRGDHIVVFKVRLPSQTSSKEVKDILNEMVSDEWAHRATYYQY